MVAGDGGGNIGGVQASINSAVDAIATAQNAVTHAELTAQKVNNLSGNLLSLKLSVYSILGGAQTLLKEANMSRTRAQAYANYAAGNMSADAANNIIAAANTAIANAQAAVSATIAVEAYVNNINSLAALAAVPPTPSGPAAAGDQGLDLLED